MTLTVSSGGGGARIRCIDHTESSFSTPRLVNFPYPSRTRFHVVSAAKKTSTSTGRFDSRKRRSLVPTTTKEQSEEQNGGYDDIEFADEDGGDRTVVNTRFRGDPADAPKFSIKDLPGLEPDPFEGPQWDGLGFFVQYLWAFGILFAVISIDRILQFLNKN